MSFWKSGLIKKLQDGELPAVKTDNEVSISSDSLMKLGLVLVSVATVIALLVIIVRKTTK